jgi:hypothetical protein
MPPAFAGSTDISADAARVFATRLTAAAALTVAGETAEGRMPMRHTNPMSTLRTRLFNVC